MKPFLPLISFLLLWAYGHILGQAQRRAIIEHLQGHVSYLSCDSLAGRATGSKGEHRAALYLAHHLRAYGVQPFGDRKTYFQHIPMHGSKPLASTHILLTNGSAQKKLHIERDFLLFKSGAQTFLPKATPLVFVGYGISAPEYDYNDYQTVNVQGKIVVFLPGEPLSSDETYFNGSAPTVYSYPESKQRTAIAHGAIGSILLHIPNRPSALPWAHYRQAFSFEDVTLAYRVTGNLSVLLNATHFVAEFLFRGCDYSLEEILQMAANHTMRSFALKTQLQFSGQFAERDFVSQNVVGLLPANVLFPKDEYVIVSAHYDHLGIGLPVKGDSIYNGAMDNAMGTAGALELARILQASSQKRKRHLLFLFVTGEEKGLLGSTYYTDHPRVPLFKTSADVNIDGLAMFDTFNDVVGVGAEYSTLGLLLQKVAQEDSLSSSPVPPQFLQYESFARSDQMAFAWAGIPSILIMDGLNYRHLTFGEGLQKWLSWNREIYHSPFDDMHQPVCWQAAAQHVQFLARFVRTLLNSNREIVWKDGLPFKNIRLQTIAEQR